MYFIFNININIFNVIFCIFLSIFVFKLKKNMFFFIKSLFHCLYALYKWISSKRILRWRDLAIHSFNKRMIISRHDLMVYLCDEYPALVCIIERFSSDLKLGRSACFLYRLQLMLCLSSGLYLGGQVCIWQTHTYTHGFIYHSDRQHRFGS